VPFLSEHTLGSRIRSERVTRPRQHPASGSTSPAHPVGTTALVVDLVFDADDGPKVLGRWRDLIGDAPRQATLTARAGAAGNWDFMPAALHGRRVIGPASSGWANRIKDGRCCRPGTDVARPWRRTSLS
jgi:hypothetical protein